MRTISENMHTWSLDEMLDQGIAPVGTQERAAFDADVAERVQKIMAKQKRQEQKVSFHITIPISMRDAIKRNATELGESANVYITNILAQTMPAVAI